MLLCVDNININYTDEGEGEVVLLLHGWGCEISTLASIAGFLKSKKRVITIDFLGHGKSDFPPEKKDNKPFNIFDYADFTKKILKKLKIESCEIVAHSFGARVAILLCQDESLVKKLVITGGAGIVPKRSFLYYFKVYKYKIGKKISNVAFIDKMFQIKEKSKTAGSLDYQALAPVMKKVFVAVVNQDLKKYLKNIKAPTLLLWGKNDNDTPLYFAKIMEKEIPNCGLVVFENSGHYAFLDEPEKFKIITKTFLEVENS